jgi:hypothetical protein
MVDSEYFAAPGLSNSGLRDLAVSPLRYWWRNLSPDRPKDEATPEMQIGSALHAAILEPESFHQRYACECIPPDGCLDTIEDLRNALDAVGLKAKGTAKGPIIQQVQDALPNAPILAVLKQQHAIEHAGKVIFKDADWQRICGMKAALLQEPRVMAILDGPGKPEQPIFVKDTETGILLKGKLDWLAPTLTMELKTFSQKRGKSIDKSVADAIFYEAYYRQAVMYAILRGWPKDFSGEFVMAFVESDPPHETRLRVLRPKTAGNANLYWVKAQLEVKQMIRLYAECQQHFGDAPWRYACEIVPLCDEELPGMAYAA